MQTLYVKKLLATPSGIPSTQANNGPWLMFGCLRRCCLPKLWQLVVTTRTTWQKCSRKAPSPCRPPSLSNPPQLSLGPALPLKSPTLPPTWNLRANSLWLLGGLAKTSRQRTGKPSCVATPSSMMCLPATCNSPMGNGPARKAWTPLRLWVPGLKPTWMPLIWVICPSRRTLRTMAPPRPSRTPTPPK